jgi:hypothetical protein
VSDVGRGGGEPDVAGAGGFRTSFRGAAGGLVARAGVKLGNVAGQTTEFTKLAAAIDSVTKSLEKLSQKSESYSANIARNLGKAANSMQSGTAGPGATTASAAFAQQRSTIPTASGAPLSAEPNDSISSGNGRAGTFTTAASWLGNMASSDMAASIAMTPLRFVRDRMQINRNVVLSASNQLNMAALRGGGRGGVSQETMLDALGRNPGGVKGTTGEMIGLMEYASRTGAAYGYGSAEATGVRGAGFFQGVQQAQVLNPGASVQSIASAIGGQAGNTAAQQQSMMMTGGAFSMIGGGGRQKSLTEWADSIMKWLIDLRPGDMRGKKFTYGELMAQYYPGSNIDAWFNVNGVSPEMREYWWTYELGRLGGSVGQDEQGIFQTSAATGSGRAAQKNNLAALRLESTNVMAQGEFALGSKMSGAYGNREQSNRAFNEMIQSFLASALPAALASGPLAGIQFMPDMIEDILFGLLERMPNSAQTIIGGLGAGSMLLGDVGDVGDSMAGNYGAQGGTTTSGMHPDMRRKIGAMQRANPRIRVTSGLRDTGLQQRLKKKGYKNVSGKASAHTRGMAADLGPASEYGWIAQNANKFGLSSGKGHGEPWHVGMGDIGDGITDFFSNLMSGGSGTAETMFDMMSGLLGMLGRGMGADATAQGPAFDAGLYNRLQTSMRGGITLKNMGGGGAAYTGTGVIPGGQVAAAGSDAGVQAATALFNAGFRNRADLEKMTAIAWRESRWNPMARNPATSDRGLMQINMSGQKKLLQELGYGELDLYDIQKNAQVAYRVYQDAGYSYWPWGMTQNGWSKQGDPLYGTQGANASAVVKAADLPVIGDMAEYATPMGGPVQMGKTLVFHNTFNVGGGGGGGGIDVRRSVTQIADHLESEMKQRMARTN